MGHDAVHGIDCGERQRSVSRVGVLLRDDIGAQRSFPFTAIFAADGVPASAAMATRSPPVHQLPAWPRRAQ
jgi:hypothetical protein